MALVSVVISVFTIRHSNKNSRQQILVSKLEEMYALIQTLSRNYGKFMDLYGKVESLKDRMSGGLQTLDQYYQVRDKIITPVEAEIIGEQISRLEVLTRCYLNGSLKERGLKFGTIMDVFFEYIWATGSLRRELLFPNAFPKYEDFFSLAHQLKEDIVAEVEL